HVVQEPVDAVQVRLQAVGRRALAPDLQEPLVDPAPEVDADRPHVAHDLPGRLLEGDEQRLLPAGAGGIDRLRGQGRLAGAGGAADEHGGTAVDAAGQHVV